MRGTPLWHWFVRNNDEYTIDLWNRDQCRWHRLGTPREAAADAREYVRPARPDELEQWEAEQSD
jgi:hypothetical protein